MASICVYYILLVFQNILSNQNKEFRVRNHRASSEEHSQKMALLSQETGAPLLLSTALPVRQDVKVEACILVWLIF